MGQRLVIGTRGSKLALTQSEMVAAELRAMYPGLEVELQLITTKGDQVLDVALSAVGDKGLFVKELEVALLEGQVDLCVHSGKDMPSVLPDGLTLTAFPQRATPFDVLVLPGHSIDSNDSPVAIIDNHTLLPAGARVGTSSLRRACQLRAARPDVQLLDVRGNVDTRLRKLADGQYDAIVLAAAGLERLGLLQTAVGDQGMPMELNAAHFTVFAIPAGRMLPAVAQGALAIEARNDDTATLQLLAALDHAPTRAAVLAERAFLRRLEGGCQVPIAAHARVEGTSVQLSGMVGNLDGSQTLYGQLTGHADDPEPIGTLLAGQLIERGAEQILAALRERAEAGA